MFHPTLGVMNYVLGTRGWDWFGSPDLALLSITLVVVWHLTPFFAIILLAGLLSLPKSPYEAARIDGASTWRLFLHLTLPMMRPVCQVVLLMGVIDVIKVFGIVYTTTEGGPARLTEVVGMYVFRTGFRDLSFRLRQRHGTRGGRSHSDPCQSGHAGVERARHGRGGAKSGETLIINLPEPAAALRA